MLLNITTGEFDHDHCQTTIIVRLGRGETLDE